jgi:hypothetical protein
MREAGDVFFSGLYDYKIKLIGVTMLLQVMLPICCLVNSVSDYLIFRLTFKFIRLMLIDLCCFVGVELVSVRFAAFKFLEFIF